MSRFARKLEGISIIEALARTDAARGFADWR